MKRVIILMIALVAMSAPSYGWGREGHEAIAKIADNHLQPSAKKKIEKYLGGHSIVYYAKWMDDYRKTKEYAHTSPWHCATVDENLKYRHTPEGGDAIYGINQAIEILKKYYSNIKG